MKTIETLEQAVTLIGQTFDLLDHDDPHKPDMDLRLLDRREVSSVGVTRDGRAWIGLGHHANDNGIPVIAPAITFYLPVTIRNHADGQPREQAGWGTFEESEALMQSLATEDEQERQGCMSIREQHFVTFLSPGTFVHETTTKPIESWDPPMAARMARDIVERHGARPFAFYFATFTVVDDIDDGAGGKLRVQPRRERTSGRYYLGGTLLTIADVEARGESILLSNMRCNGWTHVVESTRSYRTVQPFEADDAIVDDDGRTILRGNEPMATAVGAVAP